MDPTLKQSVDEWLRLDKVRFFQVIQAYKHPHNPTCSETERGNAFTGPQPVGQPELPRVGSNYEVFGVAIHTCTHAK